MDVRIVDTTLRDGEQRAGIALGIKEKIKIAGLLDKMGIYQIEAGIPAMGGSEKTSIEKIVGLNLNSKIAAWNRMVIEDIKHSIDCGVEIIHISAPSSDLQIKAKLNKDRSFVIDNLKRCIHYAVNKGAFVSFGLEDASRADFLFLLELIGTAQREGAGRVRYADTVGILHSKRIYEEIQEIKKHFSIELEIHTHNDFGMAVSSSIAAVSGGVDYVDCTIGGLGERAGNCNYVDFIRAAKGSLNQFQTIDLTEIIDTQNEILSIIHK